MSAIPDRVCAQCGATFTPTRVKARFCSLECKHAWWAAHRPDRRRNEPLEPRKCAHCGREFAPRDGRQKYCSSYCQHRAWDHAHGVGQFSEERRCAVCGKAFVATRPDRVYCSPNCAAAAYRDRNRTKFEPRACLWCGTVFTPTHHKGAQFCSPNCRHSYRYRHGSRDVTCAPRRTGGVDRAKVEAYLRLPDDERYARCNELTQAERLLAMRIWNEWHLREEGRSGDVRVALDAVDGHNYPNLALMRISAWHKARGDSVEWFMPLARYDRVYASKVFTFTPDDPYLPPDAIRGGTGYDVASRLPPEVEAMKPDYTIYPQFSEAYGFLTRGCVNRCPWCVVPKKEGAIRIEADIGEVCNTNTGFRREAVLMDNNFLAAPLEFVREQVERMRALKVRVDFNQATDARLYNEETARIMARVPWSKWARLACDADAMVPHCVEAMRLMRSFGYRKDFLIYVLATNEGIASALHRIRALTAADRRTVPFVMPYRDLSGRGAKPSPDLRRLARWCNRAWIRKSCKWEEYSA